MENITKEDQPLLDIFATATIQAVYSNIDVMNAMNQHSDIAKCDVTESIAFHCYSQAEAMLNIRKQMIEENKINNNK